MLQDLIQEDQSPRYDEYTDSDWYEAEAALHSFYQNLQAVISPPLKLPDPTSGYTRGSHEHNSQGEVNAEPYRNINGYILRSSGAKGEDTRGTVQEAG